MADNPRIEELRRRVEKDPASIAFAQLAEEYRRAGSFEEAVATCRGGLATHPSYLSARVTLGRALFELNNLDEAQTELEHVLRDRAAEVPYLQEAPRKVLARAQRRVLRNALSSVVAAGLIEGATFFALIVTIVLAFK